MFSSWTSTCCYMYIPYKLMLNPLRATTYTVIRSHYWRHTQIHSYPGNHEIWDVELKTFTALTGWSGVDLLLPLPRDPRKGVKRNHSDQDVFHSQAAWKKLKTVIVTLLPSMKHIQIEMATFYLPFYTPKHYSNLVLN